MGSTIAETINGGDGNDTICALSGNDTISGDNGIDRLFGGNDNDIFREGAVPSGADKMNGDAGADSVYYNARTAALNVNLSDVIANDGGIGEGDLITDDGDHPRQQCERHHAGRYARGRASAGTPATTRCEAATGTTRSSAGRVMTRCSARRGWTMLNLIDGINGNDNGDGGTEVDTAVQDAGDTVINVP